MNCAGQRVLQDSARNYAALLELLPPMAHKESKLERYASLVLLSACILLVFPYFMCFDRKHICSVHFCFLLLPVLRPVLLPVLLLVLLKL